MVNEPQKVRLARDKNVPVLKVVPAKESVAVPTFRDNPYSNFNFLVDLDGTVLGGFSECSGLESETDVMEYREGGDKYNSVRKLPGLNKFSNITLKRGVTGSTALYEWRQKVINGQIERREFSITLLDESRNPVYKWDIRNAWPCRRTGPRLVAGQSGVAIEEIEICHEGFSVSK